MKSGKSAKKTIIRNSSTPETTCTFPSIPLHTLIITRGCLVCLPEGIKGFTSELLHFIEQWSDYYEDDGEEGALIHDTYQYYFAENYNEEDYGYVPLCIILNNTKIQRNILTKDVFSKEEELTSLLLGELAQRFPSHAQVVCPCFLAISLHHLIRFVRSENCYSTLCMQGLNKKFSLCCISGYFI